MKRQLILFALVALFPMAALAQRGDKPGEPQPTRVPPELIPPAPALSPEEALRTFKLPHGFHIELVASEPMIECPVVASFAPDGRLWVVEMRGYMPTPDGTGESQPVGRISVLEDLNGDGRMDKGTVFASGLVMPRALLLVRDGALVAEPPNLWVLRDTNGDAQADERNLVANDYATQADPKLGANTNPEHASNGLLWALDNWIYSANHTTRFRNVAGLWQREPTVFRGQWGLTQDDYGRLIYNSNSDQLRGDLVPAEYLGRNPHCHGAYGANVQIASSQFVWPARVNPGVNRGYQEGQLRPDGTLATFTAACGPVIYRGDRFPPEFHGNAFLCEPAANLVRRNVLTEHDANITAQNPYERGEFLTSTDERFRPVNLFNAPDGALYVVDMYRGVLEHRIYVTSYLRRQIADRKLDAPLNRGRIYRVVSDGRQPGVRPGLAEASSAALVGFLAHPNGWWRDTAQRLLVERNDLSVLSELRKMAADPAKPLAQLHALWTLDGLARSDSVTLRAALASPSQKVRAAAIRLSEPLFLSAAQSSLQDSVLKLANDESDDVRVQLALTLGEVRSPQAQSVMADLFVANAANRLIRDAIVSGLAGRELEFLENLLKDSRWNFEASGRGQALRGLANCIFIEAKPERINRLLELLAQQTGPAHWRQLVLLDGIVSAAPASTQGRSASRIKPVQLSAEPPALAVLRQSATPQTLGRIETLASLLTWPGQQGRPAAVSVKPLTAEQQVQFKAGQELYLATCGACHQPHGNGQEGLAPPLTGSEWAIGPEKRMVLIALNGLRGPITVQGRKFELDMPPLGVLDDDQIANILTYIRREWGHTASPVDAATVKKIRAENETREDPWTEKELLQIH